MNDLLAYLSAHSTDGHVAEVNWQKWQITPILGGANNILYRATRNNDDWAVKFTIRDERRRAWREYQALRVLQEVAPTLAPEPLFWDEERYAHPVVVQRWMDGEVTAVPPKTDAEWQLLIAHYAALAKVTPDKTAVSLPNGVVNFSTIAEGMAAIEKQMSLIPLSHQPDSLRRLVVQLEQQMGNAPQLTPKRALCRVDANTLNFLRRADGWMSVDWENSGWGDPAFEIVDMMCHPKYSSVPHARWKWVVEQYAEMVEDETAVKRINISTPIMRVWWVARLARMVYEVPLGQDQRLVTQQPNWQTDIETKLHQYTNQAELVTHNHINFNTF